MHYLESLSGAFLRQAQEGAVEGLIFFMQRLFLGRHASTAFHFAQRNIAILLLIIFLTACAPTPVPEPQIISVYATPATQPWIAEAFACAPADTVIRVASDPFDAELSLRLGEPDILSTPAFQIDTEEILVVTQRQSPVQNMEVDEVRELFAGQGDPSVQVWVYASGEDVQRVFEQVVMEGRSVTSLARLATSPQHMSDILNNQANSVGILPHHGKAGDSRVVYTIPDVPVLALVNEDPQGGIQTLIACLQK
ncbi:MAG: hypothetical protein PVJ21_01265 [Anaerolineales bacterium]|jgi:hypothetical protein